MLREETTRKWTCHSTEGPSNLNDAVVSRPEAQRHDIRDNDETKGRDAATANTLNGPAGEKLSKILSDTRNNSTYRKE